MSELAKRSNEGKPQYHMFPYEIWEDWAKVCMMGGAKYGENNWRKGCKYSTNWNSMMRHLLAWWQHDSVDRESGLSHLIHALWNIAVLAWNEKTGQGEDDRP